MYVALPPPDERDRPARVTTDQHVLLTLLWANRAALDALTRLSPSDFRPVPVLAHSRLDRVREVFDSASDPPPTLIAQLAPLLAPRLEILAQGLARRLGRVRRETPLAGIRQIDTACLRNIARRPGRAWTEKAGPRQTLLAVERVPRFDTMENRLVKHVARAVARMLRSTVAPVRSEHPRVVAQRRLLRACLSIVDHPELEGVGRPRSGESPSNTLLGHPHYRAVWRASRLLAQEEDRFRADWTQPERLWSELRCVAVWRLLDEDERWTPVPTPLTIRRDRPPSSTRLSTTRRTWVQETASERRDVTVALEEDGVRLEMRRATSTGTSVEHRLCDAPMSLHATDPEGRPDVVLAHRSAMTLLTGWLSENRREERPKPPARAISALDRRITAAWDDHAQALGLAIAAMPDADDPSLWACGQSASHVDGFHPPRALFEQEPTGLGALLHPLMDHRTAVVVPDDLGQHALRRLQRELGRRWFIPSCMAAALQADAVEPIPQGPVLVVVRTALGLELAMLDHEIDQEHEARTGDPELVWVRGAAGVQPPPPTIPDDDNVGAWFRRALGPSWVVDPTTGAIREPTPPQEADVGAAIEAVLQEDTRVPVAVVTYGIVHDLPDAVSALPRRTLSDSALALGAARFCALHELGKPTWVEHLQALELEASVDRQRRRVSLLEARRVRPGQQVSAESEPVICLSRGLAALSLPFFEGRRSTPYRLVVDGPPLPLERDTWVSVRLDWCYGQGGLTGELRAHDSNLFRALPFRLESGTTAPSTQDDTHPPPDRKVYIPSDLIPKIASWVNELGQLLSSAGRKKSKKHKSPVDVVDRAKTLLQDVTRAADAIERTDADALPATDRAALEAVADDLDAWLGGRAPKRHGGARIALPGLENDLVKARSRLGVHTRGLDAAGLVKHHNGLDLLSRVVDGEPSSLRLLLDVSPTGRQSAPSWGKALARALRRNPAILPRISDGDARRMLAGALEGLEHQADSDKPNKYAVFGFALLLQELCYLRAHNVLPPEQCADAVARCEKARLRLPRDVREFGESTSRVSEGEQLAIAIDWLRGDYRARVRTEGP
ncbi:MAG: hypothetical protein H6734_22975 [Alphaproteobacteria bacterium]|nr:hypothetical protein [Alphaproteobacteria bacterium]